MKSSDLVCLKISDYGTDGLTGDDWDEKGNFRKLCVQNFSMEKSPIRRKLWTGEGSQLDAFKNIHCSFSSRIEGRKKLRIFEEAKSAHEMDGNHGLMVPTWDLKVKKMEFLLQNPAG